MSIWEGLDRLGNSDLVEKTIGPLFLVTIASFAADFQSHKQKPPSGAELEKPNQRFESRKLFSLITSCKMSDSLIFFCLPRSRKNILLIF